MTGMLDEDRYMFIIISPSLLFGVRNLSERFIVKMLIHILY